VDIGRNRGQVSEREMTTHQTRIPSLVELDDLLRKSEKFQNWNKLPDKFRPEDLNPAFSVDEKHFKPEELAEAWGVSTETIRSIFREEPGVLKIGNPATRSKRGYFTLRIPMEVAERVRRRLSA
jgi:hypothetical protein